eukprot:688259-Rhodomonas_salina.1
MFASEAEAHAAAQKFFHSNPSFKQQVAEELNLRVVHYGKAITPAEKEFKAPMGQTAPAPATFEIETVDMNLKKVMDASSTSNKGVQFLSVSFTPDQSFVLPASSDFIAATSVRIGSGASIEDVAFTSVCSSFLSNDAAQAQFDRILSQTCAPSDISICDFSVADLSSPFTFHVPLLAGAYDMNADTLFIQFEVSMQDPSSGVVFTSPLGASLSLSAAQPGSFCASTPSLQEESSESTPAPVQENESEDSEPATTSAEDAESNIGTETAAASYNADSEELEPFVGGEENNGSKQPMPTMAVGSGAAVLVVVLASGAGVVVLRKRKAQKRSDDIDADPSSSVWLEKLQTQVTSDFALGPAGSEHRHPKEFGAGDLDVRSAEHLGQRLTRAAMADRLCGTAEASGMVSAMLCVDDGASSHSKGARTVDSATLGSAGQRVVSAKLVMDD